MKKINCFICDSENTKLKKESIKSKINGIEVSYFHMYILCKDCSAEFVDQKTSEMNVKQRSNARKNTEKGLQSLTIFTTMITKNLDYRKKTSGSVYNNGFNSYKIYIMKTTPGLFDPSSSHTSKINIKPRIEQNFYSIPEIYKNEYGAINV